MNEPKADEEKEAEEAEKNKKLAWPPELTKEEDIDLDSVWDNIDNG